MGFPRQEHWSGLPFPLPEDLPDSGIEPESPVAPTWPADSPLSQPWMINIRIKISTRNINDLRYEDNSTIIADSKE